jgi:periplasmic protein TonB
MVGFSPLAVWARLGVFALRCDLRIQRVIPISLSNMNATAEPSSLRPPPKQALSRNAVIAIAVVGLHIGFIWALQSGLLMRAAELVVPVALLSQFIEPPTPKVEPTPPLVPKPPVLPTPVTKTVSKPVLQPAPQPLAIADPTPSPNAPLGVTTPQPALPPITAPVTAPVAAPVAVANTAVAPAAAPAVQLPSSDAEYLQNPRPPYPPISRRLNEQGKTTVRVLIGTDGLPQRAEIVKSSGFDRLDQAAVATVMRWRYVPGKRGGVAEAMWFNVPINWVLE